MHHSGGEGGADQSLFLAKFLLILVSFIHFKFQLGGSKIFQISKSWMLGYFKSSKYQGCPAGFKSAIICEKH